MKDVFLCDT